MHSRNRKKDLVYIVKEPIELMTFLLQNVSGQSRTSIKSLLVRRMIQVNDKIVSQYNYLLRTGENVTVLAQKGSDVLKGIHIIYEDDEIIAIDKRSGILSVPTPTENRNTVYRILTDYVQQYNRSDKVYIVHRLDQYTSGVMIFVKSENLQKALRDAWTNQVEERIYIAVIEGRPEKTTGKIESWLIENKLYQMYSTENHEEGKKAVTYYKILKSKEKYSLAEVWLDTGRKNQIRIHFKDMGFPVAGDRKYGAATDPCGRLMLHAKTLKLIHPFTGQKLLFESNVPQKFLSLF